VVYSLRQQGIFYSFVTDFSPRGRKIGNNKMISTALPKAKTGFVMWPCSLCDLKLKTEH
jgi:hypothetical protein